MSGPSNLMCPFCGKRMACPTGLTPTHNTGFGHCPGSEQNPRCIDSDLRPLWNGEPSPAFKARAAAASSSCLEGEPR